MRVRPNIIFIMPDQLRHDMLGCYGHPCAITPNIDQLAQNGIRFQNCYSTNPVCLPARASIITGKYCNQHHCHSNSNSPSSDEICWPALLRDNGYYTALVGKLHLWEQYRDPCFSAIDHGFQYKQMTEGKASVNNGVEESGWYFDYLLDRDLPIERQQTADDLRLGRSWISQYDEYDHIDGLIGARAVRQIINNRKLSKKLQKPFCMQVGFCSPHEQYDPPKRFFDMYDRMEIPDPVFDPLQNLSKSPAFQAYVKACADRTGFAYDEGYDAESIERINFMRRCYLATVTFVDHQVGLIVKALKDAGIYENTVIIFTSDHGEFIGERGGIQKEFFLYEDNLHVPLIISAPFLDLKASAPAGLVQNIDIFGTILDIAGINPPEDMMSQSLLPIMHAPSRELRDAVFAETLDRKMVIQNGYKLIMEKDPLGTELYDLKNDPGETINLARNTDNPLEMTSDPDKLVLINQLLQKIIVWQQDCEGVPYQR